MYCTKLSPFSLSENILNQRLSWFIVIIYTICCIYFILRLSKAPIVWVMLIIL